MLIAAESGCNDGAAFPFLYLSLYLITYNSNTGKAIGMWFLQLWVCMSPFPFPPPSFTNI